MTALTLPTADVDLLSTLAATLGRPGLDADITDLVSAHAERLNVGYRRPGRTDLVSLLARLAGLLDLPPSDDTRLLTARLRATPLGTDCVLSDAEEAAHARTADRMNDLWAHGSGIDRYLYRTGVARGVLLPLPGCCVQEPHAQARLGPSRE